MQINCEQEVFECVYMYVCVCLCIWSMVVCGKAVIFIQMYVCKRVLDVDFACAALIFQHNTRTTPFHRAMHFTINLMRLLLCFLSLSLSSTLSPFLDLLVLCRDLLMFFEIFL